MTNFENAEKSLLGTMLQENYLISDSGVQLDFFTSAIHKSIFSCMQQLVASNRPVDYITIMTLKEPTELGGANYLSELPNFANATRFDQYKELVAENWKEREKGKLLQQAQMENWEIGEIQKAFDSLQEENSSAEETSIQMDLVKLYERPYKPAENDSSVTTGLRDLDQLLNGFQRKELTIVAARPSMGKTDVLNHLALQAGQAGYLPIIFSLEMGRDSMIDRLIASSGGYNRLKMRDPYTHFTPKQKDKWIPSLTDLNRANIHIDDRAGLTVNQIKAKARKIIKANRELKPIIYVDYLQIIRPENPRDNQTQAIGQISGDLKRMAKEFDCPVVCLSQLSRDVEKRENKRPMMSDLRDSGNIEQDADVITFLYREDYYDKETENQNILELVVAKHRNGPTGTVTVSYIKDTGRLYNIDWSNHER